MLSRKETRKPLPDIDSGRGVVVSTQNPDGGWQITCPECDTVHRSKDRLCPLCTKHLVHKLQVENRRILDQNDRLRDLVSETRNELFKSWHAEEIAKGSKSPVVAVEKRWSKFLKTVC